MCGVCDPIWLMNILEEKFERVIPRHDDPLTLAGKAESKALAEYTRVFRMFSELTLHGRIPEEQGYGHANECRA
jgi:hypothetical protein